MIKDKIILGLENKKLRSKLLESSQDTLEQIIEKCKIAELSETNKKILNTEEDVIKVEAIKSFTVNKTKQPYVNRQRNTQTCERCGMTSSLQHGKFCPAVVEGRTCRICHKPGHFAVMCRKKYSGRRSNSSNYVQAVGGEEREQTGAAVKSTQSVDQQRAADQQRGIHSVNINRQYYDDADV
ncbi:uncharacterized protein LOC129941769 [Eupeodes corollae]|uniref:uncharacterized protein LOC129941769 n=1 Tax=Eupeodes corollae TaxID=290404 RepID=UPI0024932CCD|nr:uncharacterized protein LOC129941769 [Eupeodes corollae]